VYVADRTGIVHALDPDGKIAWKAYTAGAIYYPPAIAHDRLYVGSADGRVYTFEAKTGRLLWTFRVAPQVDRIRVYDRLISRWPVAGGVVVEGGRVYAAAGIAHYDGTYLVALDAVTGELKAANGTSGALAANVNSGVSLQGELRVEKGELRFLGGGVYETARYDLKTLQCLNPPHTKPMSAYRTAFYPYYPDYGKYVSLEYQCADGCVLTHAASYEGSYFSRLGLQGPLPKGATKPVQDAANDYLRRRGQAPAGPKFLWEDNKDLRFTGFIGSKDRFLAAGHTGIDAGTAFLESRATKDGQRLWSHQLPALPVQGGTAIDSQGRIYLALENGQVLCFAKVK
jgi:outer membrane protein assembly factor BamB